MRIAWYNAAAAAVIAATAFAAGPAAAETTLSLVYPFPDSLIYTKSCKALVEKINAAGAGEVKIDVKPFNSIKMFQQPDAVSKGAVDMVCTPAAFYAAKIPENEAISTSNSAPTCPSAISATTLTRCSCISKRR